MSLGIESKQMSSVHALQCVVIVSWAWWVVWKKRSKETRQTNRPRDWWMYITDRRHYCRQLDANLDSQTACCAAGACWAIETEHNLEWSCKCLLGYSSLTWLFAWFPRARQTDRQAYWPRSLSNDHLINCYCQWSFWKESALSTAKPYKHPWS